MFDHKQVTETKFTEGKLLTFFFHNQDRSWQLGSRSVKDWLTNLAIVKPLTSLATNIYVSFCLSWNIAKSAGNTTSLNTLCILHGLVSKPPTMIAPENFEFLDAAVFGQGCPAVGVELHVSLTLQTSIHLPCIALRSALILFCAQSKVYYG